MGTGEGEDPEEEGGEGEDEEGADGAERDLQEELADGFADVMERGHAGSGRAVSGFCFPRQR